MAACGACLQAATTRMVGTSLGQRDLLKALETGPLSCSFSTLWGATGLRNAPKDCNVKVLASTRKFWRNETSVEGRVTNRARLVIRELRSSLDEQSVWEVLRRWVRGMTPRRRDWLDLLIEFDNFRDRDLYFKVFHFALDEQAFEVCARDYTKLVDKYGKLERLDEAESALKEMLESGFAPDVVTYTVLISLYGRLGLVDRARDAFEQIGKAGLKPDSKALTALIVAYGLASLPAEAEALLTASPALMSADAFTALISAYGRAGEAIAAERVFNLMQVNGVRPTLKAFTALIDAYTKAGHAEGAVKTFQLLLDLALVPDDRLISRMIVAYEKAGTIEMAVQLLVDLEKAQIRPGPDALTTLMGYLARYGLVTETEEVYRDYLNRGFRLTPRVATNMYEVYARSGQLEKVRGVLQVMNDARMEVDEGGYNRLIQSLLVGKLSEEAGSMYQKMVEKGWELSASVKSSLLEAQKVMV